MVQKKKHFIYEKTLCRHLHPTQDELRDGGRAESRVGVSGDERCPVLGSSAVGCGSTAENGEMAICLS